jgi:hypothetical protein
MTSPGLEAAKWVFAELQKRAPNEHDRSFFRYGLNKDGKNHCLLLFYLERRERTPKKTIARIIAALNRECPRERRLGPSGSTNWRTILQQINRLISHKGESYVLNRFDVAFHWFDERGTWPIDSEGNITG